MHDSKQPGVSLLANKVSAYFWDVGGYQKMLLY